MSDGYRMPHGKIRRRIILAVFLAMLWISKSEAEQNYCPTPTHKGETCSYYYGTKSNPFAIDIVSTEKDKNTAAQEEKDRQEKRQIDIILIVIGIAQSFIFLLQLGAFFYQAGFMRGTVDEMKLATIATQDLAKAARDSADNAKNTAERQLRAYVTARGHAAVAAPPFGNPVKYDTPHKKIRAGDKVVIHITMKNTGQTPAKNVHVTSDIKLVDWPINPKDLPYDFDNQDPNDTHGSQDNLGTGEELMFSMALKYPLTQADMMALERKEKAVVVYGIITYRDIFGLMLRTTHFRFNIGGAWGVKGYNVTTDNKGNDMT